MRIAIEHQVRTLADLRAFLDQAADGGKIDLADIPFYPESTFIVEQGNEGGDVGEAIEGKLRAVVRFD